MKVPPLSERNKLIAFIALVACIDLILLRNVLFIGAFQSSDIDIPFFGRSQIWTSIFSAWNYQNLGQPSGFAGLFFINGFPSAITGNPATIEKIVYYSSLPTSSILAYFLLKYWGMTGKRLWLASILYQFSPWLIGEFMTGEPALTWTMALFPLYALIIMRLENNTISIKYFIYTTALFIVVLSFTFEALLIYAFLSIPFLARLFTVQNLRHSMRALAMLLCSVVLGIGGNLFSLGPYLVAYVGATRLPTYGLFGGFNSQPAILLKTWLLMIIGFTSIVTLSRANAINSGDATLSVYSVLISSLFGLLYFLIPSTSIAFLYKHIFFLATFLDYDRFLLMSWTLAFLVFTLVLRDIRCVNPIFRPGKISVTKLSRIHVFLSKAMVLGRGIKEHKTSRIIALILIAIVLVSASLFSSIQPQQAHITGADFIAGNVSFDHKQIPIQYYKLRQFLLKHNASFGFGYHVLVVPQTPGSVIPFYVGVDMIPGYIGPSPSTNNLINSLVNGIITNNSNYADIMALVGIKYIIVLPSQGDESWPGGVGPPALSAWGNNAFPTGNASAYLRILGGWKNLEPVYHYGGMTVFRNELYTSPALIYRNCSAIQSIGAGNFFPTYNATPIPRLMSVIQYNLTQTGQELVLNRNLTYGTDWNVQAYNGNASLLNNGSFRISYGSYGISASQQVTLQPDRYYMLRFNIHAYPGNGTKPQAYRYDVAGLWWVPNGVAYNYGAIIPFVSGGNISGEQQFVFKTPDYNGSFNATFTLYAEPPLHSGTIYTTYHGVTLYAIAGNNTFANLVQPAKFLENNFNLVSINIGGGKVTSPKQYVTLDISYSPMWKAIDRNGRTISGFKGIFGLLTFSFNGNDPLIKIFYTGQTRYTLLLFVSFSISVIIFGMLLVIFVFIIRNRIGGRYSSKPMYKIPMR